MTTKKWILLISFIVGLIILLLPDHGEPVMSLNERHGPSFLDLTGLLLMMISWFVSWIVVIRKWKDVKLKTGNLNSRLLVAVYIISMIGVAFSLIFSVDPGLWLCVAAGAFINILFIVHAFHKE